MKISDLEKVHCIDCGLVKCWAYRGACLKHLRCGVCRRCGSHQMAVEQKAESDSG